jgi:hypothetical protein
MNTRSKDVSQPTDLAIPSTQLPKKAPNDSHDPTAPTKTTRKKGGASQATSKVQVEVPNVTANQTQGARASMEDVSEANRKLELKKKGGHTR